MVLLRTDFMESNINMKNTKQNPIANIANQLVGVTKAKADTKPSKAVITLGDEVTLKAITKYADGVAQGESSINLMNDALKVFHDAKVKLCKASEKSSPLFDYSNKVRTMFVDSFLAQGKKKAYVEKMMYPAFLRAVNSGKPISQINASQEKAKAKGGKGKTQSDSAKVINALKTIWQLSDAEPQAIEFIETELDKGASLIDAIQDYLASEGVSFGDE